MEKNIYTYISICLHPICKTFLDLEEADHLFFVPDSFKPTPEDEGLISILVFQTSMS